MDRINLMDNFSLLFESRIYLTGQEPWLSIGRKLLESIGLEGEDCGAEEKTAGDSEKNNLVYIVCGKACGNCSSPDEMNMSTGAEEMGESLVFSLLELAMGIRENAESSLISAENRVLLSMNYAIESKARKVLSCKMQLEHIRQLAGMSEPVLVYQPGKVGSSTIYASLKAGGIESFHLHALNPYGGYLHFPEEMAEECNALVEQIKKQEKTIITVVREPVGRDLAAYFEEILFLKDRICIPETGGKNPVKSQEEYFRWIMKSGKERVDRSDEAISYWYFDEFRWFDEELKAVFGVDVFQYPFDKKQGYCIIEEGNLRILILRMENSDSWEMAIRKFLHLQDFRMEKAVNLGETKMYASLYKEVKENLCLPEEYVEYYKHNEKCIHFYDEPSFEEEKHEYRKIIAGDERSRSESWSGDYGCI